MKNSIITIITLFLFCSIAEAQQDTIFYNSDWKETKVKDSVEFYRLVKFDNTVKLYAVTDYYKEGKPQMKAYSSDKKGELFEGKVEWFAKEGYLDKYIIYNKGLKQGDSKEFNQNGTTLGEGYYKDDSLDGEWKWYYSNSKLSVVETYNKGKLINLKGWDENGKEQILDIKIYEPEKSPEFPSGYNGMVNFFIKNLKYPKKAIRRGIQGSVYVMFSVESDGLLTDIKIARSVDEFLDAEALRVVSLMPKWEIGLYHNKPVKVNKVTIPIKFQFSE